MSDETQTLDEEQLEDVEPIEEIVTGDDPLTPLELDSGDVGPAEAEIETDAEPQVGADADLQARIERLERQKQAAEDRAAYLQRTLESGPAQPAEMAQGQPQTPMYQGGVPRPQEGQYDDYDQYIEALTDWKTDQKILAYDQLAAQRQFNNVAQQRRAQLDDKLQAGFERYDDFEEVALHETVPISQLMAEILADTENPADIAYYLGKNPKECAEIARMTPTAVARAIGRLEVKVGADLAANPPVAKKRPSKAPPPIKPVSGGVEVVTPDLDKVDFETYKKIRRKQQQGG